MARAGPISVVETPTFLAAARKMMDAAERALLVDYLAYNPAAGDLIPGTGGDGRLGGRWRDEVSAAAHGSSISTLRRFIEAMGGELEIVARFPDHAIKIRNFADLTERQQT